MNFDNVCIVGAGAIGSVFGCFLSNAGYKVNFLEKNENIVKQIKENGLSISGEREIRCNNVNISLPGSITEKQDLILLAIKAYNLEEAVESSLPLIGKDTYVKDGAAVCGQQGLNGWLSLASGIDFLYTATHIAVRGEIARKGSGKVEGFDCELSQKEFLISGMCQTCQDEIFGASEEDYEEICMVTFG